MTARDLRLAGRRVLVVGASAGIGRAAGIAVARAGATVALVARRVDRLEEVCDGLGEVGRRVAAIGGDVRDPDQVDRFVGASVDALGGLDSMVYATGVTHLSPLAETDAEGWRFVLETNLVGASLTARAALPHLRTDTARGRMVFLSSDSAALPYPGLGAYAASKAALDRMVDAWRTECPDLALTRLVVGPTMTDAASTWDPEVLDRMLTRWADEGYLQDVTPQQPDEVAAVVVEVLAALDPPADAYALPDGFTL